MQTITKYCDQARARTDDVIVLLVFGVFLFCCSDDHVFPSFQQAVGDIPNYHRKGKKASE